MIQAGIFGQITQDPTLAGLLTDGSGGFNVYPFEIPEEFLEQFDNFVTYFKISDKLDKYCGYSVAIFQINAASKTYDDVQVLAQNIIRVFEFFVGDMGGMQLVERSIQQSDRELFDKETGLYFIPIDFKFIFK